MSISSSVEELVGKRPLVLGAISSGIVNYANLAAKIRPEIEKSHGKVSHSAIIMALRRYSSKIRAPRSSSITCNEVILKSGLMRFVIKRNRDSLKIFTKLTNFFRSRPNETLNLLWAQKHCVIIVSASYGNYVRKLLSYQTIAKIDSDITLIQIRFGEKRRYPGLLDMLSMQFSWAGIDIYDHIFSLSELSLFVGSDNATKGYEKIMEVIKC